MWFCPFGSYRLSTLLCMSLMEWEESTLWGGRSRHCENRFWSTRASVCSETPPPAMTVPYNWSRSRLQKYTHAHCTLYVHYILNRWLLDQYFSFDSCSSFCVQIGHYHGVMTSMLGLGQLSTVITQVNGVLANKWVSLTVIMRRWTLTCPFQGQTSVFKLNSRSTTQSLTHPFKLWGSVLSGLSNLLICKHWVNSLIMSWINPTCSL